MKTSFLPLRHDDCKTWEARQRLLETTIAEKRRSLSGRSLAYADLDGFRIAAAKKSAKDPSRESDRLAVK